MLADVRLGRINSISDLSDYKQGDLNSELAYILTHTQTHTHDPYKHILQFQDVSRDRNVSHPTPLILIHPRGIRRYTRSKQPQDHVTVFPLYSSSSTYSRTASSDARNLRSAVSFAKLKKTQGFSLPLLRSTTVLKFPILSIWLEQCSQKKTINPVSTNIDENSLDCYYIKYLPQRY